MLLVYALFSLNALIQATLAQVSLPSTPWLPPSAESGAVPSNSTSIPNPQWSTLLGNLIYFYDAQRSGKLPDSNRVSWRNDSCLDDGKDAGLDLSGGYYDAGDYIKATYPLSFTLMQTCWGALEYGQGYDLSNQTAYLDSMLRWGLDWMIKAHPSNDTLYVLVGDTNTDDAYWGGDQDIPSFRPSFQINDTSPGTDAAAGASAAFSACSALYAGQGFPPSLSSSTSSSPVPSLQNSTYAATLLSHATSLFAFAVNASGGQRLYQDSVPAVAASYGSSSFGDELTLGALFLAWAANSTDYFAQAESLYDSNKLAGQDGVFNWDSKTPGLAVLFAQVLNERPYLAGTTNLSKWQAEAERYLDNVVSGNSQARLTNGGLLWYSDGDSDQASLNPGLNLAFLLSLYAPFSTSAQKSTSYTSFASTQLAYALGNNPMHVPYVVGTSPNSPQNPHSALASGASPADLANIDTVPAQEAYVLYGALVGGPDADDNFFDIRSDWPETEPAVDLNPPLMALAALHVMNDTQDPFYTSLKDGAYVSVKPQGTPCDALFPCRRHGMSEGAKIAVGVIVTVVGLAIFGSVGYLVWRRWQEKKRAGY